MPNKFSLIILVLVASIVTLFSASFVIPEGRQAVLTQFGKPVRSVSEAGLHFKTPFIQDVRMIDLRILNWDGNPNQIPTKDKKYIEVDTTARWKIADPLKFIQTVQNENGARTRLDAILDGVTRDVISSHNLVESVRNSNNIIDTIEKRSQALKKERENSEAGTVIAEEEVTGEIEYVEIGREKLSQLIITPARVELESLGIELIDVQFKRIAYEKSVQQKVYLRMISERETIAGKIRSYGKGEKAKIEGKTSKDLNRIQSESYRTVQTIRGDAEARALTIYANAFNRDPDFYRFSRTLEAYDSSLPAETKLLLSSKSKFWEILRSGKPD